MWLRSNCPDSLPSDVDHEFNDASSGKSNEDDWCVDDEYSDLRSDPYCLYDGVSTSAALTSMSAQIPTLATPTSSAQGPTNRTTTSSEQNSSEQVINPIIQPSFAQETTMVTTQSPVSFPQDPILLTTPSNIIMEIRNLSIRFMFKRFCAPYPTVSYLPQCIFIPSLVGMCSSASTLNSASAITILVVKENKKQGYSPHQRAAKEYKRRKEDTKGN